jgi:microcystin-dependent protein
VQATGSGQPHDNLSPFQVVTFIIALDGVYPSRS